MKILKKIFDNVRPLVEGDKARCRIAYPLFEAAETFFFLGTQRSLGAPHVRDAIGLKRYMSVVIATLIPMYVVGLGLFGPRLLLMTLVSYVVGGVVEVIFAMIRREEINEGFLVTGLIFPMILPPSVPLWIVGFGIAFGVFFGKEVFGGTGHNIFNPALVGRCFVTLSWPVHIGSSYVRPFAWIDSALEYKWAEIITPNIDALTSATPLVEIRNTLASNETLGVFTGENFTNFLGFTSGSVCETSSAWIILMGMILCATKVANWRVPVSILISYILLSLVGVVFYPTVCATPFVSLWAGGLLFGAFFMATDPVSSPSTNNGKWVFGLCIGGLVWLFRTFGTTPEGITFAILIMNIFAPLIDRSVFRFHRVKGVGSE